MEESLQSGMERLAEQYAISGAKYRPLLQAYYCPITSELMTDPVISKDGHSYEREAIENWIRLKGVSPITRNSLTTGELRPNNALYELIQIEKRRSDESVHASVRRWRDSGEPTSRRHMPDSELVDQANPTTSAPTQEASCGRPRESFRPGIYETSSPFTEEEMRERREHLNRCDTKSIRDLVVVIVMTLVLMVLFIPVRFALMIISIPRFIVDADFRRESTTSATLGIVRNTAINTYS